MLLKIDLHVHTFYSKDSLISLDDIIRYSLLRGLDGVAVTDHDTAEGALKICKCEDLIIIPGVEVTTTLGHILGLNISTSIPKGLTPEEAIDLIHEDGGIAVSAHPYGLFKGGLGSHLHKNNYDVDAVEVINSSSFPFSLSTSLNRRLAERLSLPQTAGSDSHIPETIGLAYTIIDSEMDVESIVDAIRKGSVTPYGRGMPIKYRLKKALYGRRRSIP